VGELRRTREPERAPRVNTADRPPAKRIRFNARRVLADVKVATGATRSFISRALGNRLSKWRRPSEEDNNPAHLGRGYRKPLARIRLIKPMQRDPTRRKRYKRR